METFIKKRNNIRIHPTRIIIIGFFIVICVGTFLLNLPISSKNGQSIGFVNSLFTATSSVCVTGLVVVNTLEHWTIFGKFVILCLIQIGGLGFMSIITMFFIMIKRKITLKERMLIQESLNQDSMSGMVKLVKSVIRGTLIIEAIGAILLSIEFVPEYGIVKGISMGIFHSISAFCNAGFDIIGSESITPYVSNVYVNIVIMALIIIGGLGFTVWVDTIRIIKLKRTTNLTIKQALEKLSLHSKIILTFTPVLIISGAILIFIFECSNQQTLANLDLVGKINASVMQSVTLRTAGFNSIPQDGMTYASKFLSIILMFIGGSPAGTAGGVKTSTIAVLLITVISITRGSTAPNVWGRKITVGVIQKSLAVFIISFGVVIGFTMLLTITEKNILYDYEFIDLLFETTSAMGTVGITTGITPHLSIAGKLIISIAMFMGRIGPISIVIGLARKQGATKEYIGYPEGNIMVG